MKRIEILERRTSCCAKRSKTVLAIIAPTSISGVVVELARPNVTLAEHVQRVLKDTK
jgi:hypothetical protein